MKLQGKLVGAYCAKWEKDDKTKWCYVKIKSSRIKKYCPGAVKSTIKSSKGKTIWWSNDEEVCDRESEDTYMKSKLK